MTSRSTTGNVIMYESLGTGLNASLKNQLINLYKVLCNDDGSLNVTVVLQQRQKGASDCGLYAIANAVALALGVDPCAVSWLQNDMRQHLISCFEKRELELMFPHVCGMECDSMHTTIERKIVADIYTPRDYFVIMEAARSRLTSYRVTPIHHNDFMQLTGRPEKMTGDPTVFNLRVLEYQSIGKIR